MVKWVKLIVKLFIAYIDFSVFVASLQLILYYSFGIWAYFICFASGFNFITKFLKGGNK